MSVPLPGSLPASLATWPEHEPDHAASQRAEQPGTLVAPLDFPSPQQSDRALPEPSCRERQAQARSGQVQMINADVSDSLLQSKGQGVQQRGNIGKPGDCWDLEKGVAGRSDASEGDQEEEVDLLGGFNVNSSFDPDKDV